MVPPRMTLTATITTSIAFPIMFQWCCLFGCSLTESQFLATNSSSGPRQNFQIIKCPGTKFFSNCSHQKLDVIPQNLPVTIQILKLSYNRLTSASLRNRPFSRYRQLKTLLMDHNYLDSSLPSESFYGLQNLQELNLFRNKIQMNAELNDSFVFRPLLNLKKLNFTKNSNASDPSLKYPDHALSFLTKLEDLSLDGLINATQFGPGFSKLRNLTQLSLPGFTAGYCKMSALKNDTFIHVPNLRLLNISDCLLDKSKLEMDTLSPLEKLEVLDVSNNYYYFGIYALGDLMYGQRNNTNLKRLRMERVMARFAPCIVVYEDTTQYFKNTGLERIEARYNQIELIEIGALKNLPPTINYIDVRDNKIMFGAYWQDMNTLTNVTQILLDGQNEPNSFPAVYPNKYIECGHHRNWPDDAEGRLRTSCSGASSCSTSGVESDNPLTLQLPPNLNSTSIVDNGIAYVVQNIAFSPNNSLEWVDLSYNKFLRLMGPVTGLNELRYLNLSSCIVQDIGPKFFDHFPKLERLCLYQNRLYYSIKNDEKGQIFNNLEHLLVLDLGVNSLVSIPYLAFHSLHKLTHLLLDYNTLQALSFKINHMHNLTYLLLRANQILTLPKEAMDHISRLLEKGIPVRVNMEYNPISCECSNLEFLQWVVETGVFGQNYSRYYCSYPSSGSSLLSVSAPSDGYAAIVRQLQGECIQHKSLFLLVLGVCLLIMVIVLCGILHRFRWTLRYWYHAAKLKMASNARLMPTVQDFDFDVFVSYANEDMDFVMQELKPHLEDEYQLNLCIHARNFRAGGHITDNIYSSVTRSKRTLVVVTQHLLKSKWCRYEVQMAQQEGISKGRNVLVFLFKDERTTKSRDHDILQYVRTNTYVIYPAIQRYRDRFWRKLATDLQN